MDNKIKYGILALIAIIIVVVAASSLLGNAADDDPTHIVVTMENRNLVLTLWLIGDVDI